MSKLTVYLRAHRVAIDRDLADKITVPQFANHPGFIRFIVTG